MKLSRLLACAAALCSICLAAAQESTPPPKLAIRAARMIDGKSDTPVDNPVILVEGEKIKAIGSGLAIPKDAKVIDLGNLTLLRGALDRGAQRA